MEKRSLWEIELVDDLKVPAAILKEQAELLTSETKGVLIGKVVEYLAAVYPSGIVEDADGKLMGFSLYIVSPSMNQYHYLVLSIAYDPVTLYPVSVDDETRNNEVHRCITELTFVEWLKAILSSDRIKQVVKSLYAQSK